MNTWKIFTVAGTGVEGFRGDGGPATTARLSWPRDMALAPDGSLFIADTNNHRIRCIRRDGTMETAAGTGQGGWHGDGGPAKCASLNAPRGVEIGPDGNLYIVDTGNHCIRKVNDWGSISTIAGVGRPGYNGDGIPATEAQLSWPQDMIVTADGCIYVADSGNHRIRKIDPGGVITTIAGTGVSGDGGDGGQGIDAELSHPRGIAMDREGALYIGDSDNNRVRKVTPEGIIVTVAGCGRAGFSGDGGPATKAEIAGPRGVAVLDDGAFFIADCDNSAIRRVNSEGMITTIAGVGVEGYTGDGGPAAAAKLGDPHGILADGGRRVFFAEPHNHCIRKIVIP